MSFRCCLGTPLRWLVDYCHGRVKARHYLLQKQNTWCYPALLKRRCGWEITQEQKTCKRDLASFMRTISMPSQCPETLNSMEEQRILIYATIFIREQVSNVVIALDYCPTHEKWQIMLTKRFHRSIFVLVRNFKLDHLIYKLEPWVLE